MENIFTAVADMPCFAGFSREELATAVFIQHYKQHRTGPLPADCTLLLFCSAKRPARIRTSVQSCLSRLAALPAPYV
jgi:hypothetical protein